MTSPRSLTLTLGVLLGLNAVGYAVALATGIVDPVPGFFNGSKTHAPLMIWGAQSAGIALLVRGRRAGGALALLACTVSLAAVAFDGDLAHDGLGAGHVALQVAIAGDRPGALGAPGRLPGAARYGRPVARRLILPFLLAAALLAGTASAEAKQLTRYEVGGGIAGHFDRLIVATSGEAHQTGDSGEHDFTVSPKKLRGLKSALKAAKFKTLKRSYKPKAIVFDGTTQSIRYRGRTVSISSGANVPDRLAKLLNRLSRIMRY